MIKYRLYIKDFINSSAKEISIRLIELEEDGKRVDSFKSQKLALEFLAAYHIKHMNTTQSIEGWDILILPEISF